MPPNAPGEAQITSPTARLRVPRGALVPAALLRHAQSGFTPDLENSGRAWDPAGSHQKGRTAAGTAAGETQVLSPGVWWLQPKVAFVSPARCAAASVVLVLISPSPRNRCIEMRCHQPYGLVSKLVKRAIYRLVCYRAKYEMLTLHITTTKIHHQSTNRPLPNDIQHPTYTPNIQIHSLQNNIHVSKVHCGSAFEPGASGLPYYCASICVHS